MDSREGAGPQSGGRRAIFFDRDGVLNRLLIGAYVTRWEEFEWLPRAREALRLAHDLGWAAVVVTNQAGVGRGVQTQASLDEVHRRMRQDAGGGRIEAVYACPHRPEDGCACRKPQPGLLLRAAEELGLELAGCHLIGDSETDLAAAEAVGVQWWWLHEPSGDGAAPVQGGSGSATRPAARVCVDVLEAVRRIGPCPPA